jgi:hypothetical protein
VDNLVKKNKENKIRPEQKKIKQITKEETPKVVFTPPKKEQNSVETKGRSSEVDHHTTKKKQNGVETKESTGVHVYFSWT